MLLSREEAHKLLPRRMMMISSNQITPKELEEVRWFNLSDLQAQCLTECPQRFNHNLKVEVWRLSKLLWKKKSNSLKITCLWLRLVTLNNEKRSSQSSHRPNHTKEKKVSQR
jgi:hypothetical protein